MHRLAHGLFAVVGVGGWGIEHARAWAGMPGVELVALCERDDDRLDAAAKELGVAATYDSATALAAEVELDIVSIATHVSASVQKAPLYTMNSCTIWLSASGA